MVQAPCFSLFRANRALSGALVLLLTGALLAWAPPAAAQDAEFAGVPSTEWLVGPTTARIGNLAEIQIPAGYQFTGAEGTKTLMQVMQNPISGGELGLLSPIPPEEEAPADEETAANASAENDWFIIFEFDDIGYVSDEEKDELDADGILEAIRAGTAEGNKERQRRGWPTMEIVGWQRPPSYDPKSNNLEWAILGRSEGQTVLNYNTRILGRGGVMSANLVVAPEQLPAALPKCKTLLNGFSYLPGHQYAEYRSGDKVAEYGLAALVTGGAAAVALKTGLFQKLWKFIVFGVLAVGAFIKKLFGGGKREVQG